MAWDIYGNNLRRGYCEVHPHVQQEYPCDICCRAKRDNRQQEADWKKQQKDYYKSMEPKEDTVRVVIDDLIQRIHFSELEKDVLDIDFGGNYLIQIQKQEGTEKDCVFWTVSNAMNGYGYNCFDQMKEHKVHILTDK